MMPLTKNCGIYKIENLVNGKVYIGQSRNLKKRIQGHKNTLRKNKHENRYLQRAWNKYGEKSFSFEMLENCELEELTKRENYWIDYYKSFLNDKGYNLTIPNIENDTYTLSEKVKEKLSKSSTIYSKEELISYLHEFYYHEGRVPTQRDLKNKKHGNYPNYGTYFLVFGTFKNAIIEAGLYNYVENKKIYERKEYTKQDVIDSFKPFIEKYGRFPNSSELKNTKKFGFPTTQVIMRHFDGIQELKDIFGFTKDKELELEKTDSLNKLRELYNQDGKVTARSIDKSPITRSGKYYRNNFGSIAEACKLAGVPYKGIDLQKTKNSL